MGIVPMSATPLLENFAIIEMSVVLMQTVINIKRPHSQLGNSWLLSGICPTQLRERRNHPCLLVVADTLLVPWSEGAWSLVRVMRAKFQ